MIAMAIITLFAAVAPSAQEGAAHLEAEEANILLYEEEAQGEEMAGNEDCEYSDEIVFEEESDLLEDPSICEDEE